MRLATAADDHGRMIRGHVGRKVLLFGDRLHRGKDRLVFLPAKQVSVQIVPCVYQHRHEHPIAQFNRGHSLGALAGNFGRFVFVDETMIVLHDR